MLTFFEIAGSISSFIGFGIFLVPNAIALSCFRQCDKSYNQLHIALIVIGVITFIMSVIFSFFIHIKIYNASIMEINTQ